jgi:hypothetical protein
LTLQQAESQLEVIEKPEAAFRSAKANKGEQYA